MIQPFGDEMIKSVQWCSDLKPYRELDDGTIEGEFHVDPRTGILIIGKQNEAILRSQYCWMT